jgi:hypothetical protein
VTAVHPVSHWDMGLLAKGHRKFLKKIFYFLFWMIIRRQSHGNDEPAHKKKRMHIKKTRTHLLVVKSNPDKM